MAALQACVLGTELVPFIIGLGDICGDTGDIYGSCYGFFFFYESM
jgi:hypothetical protein